VRVEGDGSGQSEGVSDVDPRVESSAGELGRDVGFRCSTCGVVVGGGYVCLGLGRDRVFGVDSAKDEAGRESGHGGAGADPEVAADRGGSGVGDRGATQDGEAFGGAEADGALGGGCRADPCRGEREHEGDKQSGTCGDPQAGGWSDFGGHGDMGHGGFAHLGRGCAERASRAVVT